MWCTKMGTDGSGKFRYELKYVISDLQLVMLEDRIRGILRKDPHVSEKGFYTIRSLYFDDYMDSAYWEKENGTDPREKFRIRFYDDKLDPVSLEVKRKVRGKIQKEHCRITKEQCENMIKGVPAGFEKGQNLLNKFSLLQMTKAMSPKIIVEYDRTPYVGKEGNVRITFDKNIRSSSAVQRFLEKDIPMRPIMPSGRHLMEVKFDELLPDYVYRALMLENMSQTAFSKYGLCRKYWG